MPLTALHSYYLYFPCPCLAREAYLAYLRKTCFHCFDAIIAAVQSKEFNTGHLFTKARRMAIKSFTLFIESPFYAEWCQGQLGTSFDMDSAAVTQSLQNIFAHTSTNETAMHCDLPSITDSNVRDGVVLLQSNEWFRSLVSAVETLPVAVTVSLADEHNGFPLVYANQCTIAMSGLDHSSALGKPNCFYANPAIAQDLSKAIPAEHRFSFSDHAGVTGHVILISKPLYDTTSRFRFIFSVLLPRALNEDLRYMQMLLMFIPSVVYPKPIAVC
jgi:hypothetical protein